MIDNNEKRLSEAMEGDINSFQSLFSEFQDQLKSYFFRLTASRDDAEDFMHDTFVKAFDKIRSFKGDSSLKTWVFRIATNLVNDEFRKRTHRWPTNVKTLSKEATLKDPSQSEAIHNASIESQFEILEHVDTCLTCLTKSLPPKEELVLLLKEVYEFTVEEIVYCLELSLGTVKHLLQKSRSTMEDLFEEKCALVNKNGTCHQCSELAGWLSPEQREYQVKVAEKKLRANSKDQNFEMRLKLVRETNPLKAKGYKLQEELLNCNRRVMGEI